MKRIIYILILFLTLLISEEKDKLNKFTISRLHYGGGGDWYSDPSSLPNLLEFVNKNTLIITNKNENKVKVGDDQ